MAALSAAVSQQIYSKPVVSRYPSRMFWGVAFAHKRPQSIIDVTHLPASVELIRGWPKVKSITLDSKSRLQHGQIYVTCSLLPGSGSGVFGG